ncbi:MAG: hypothetical protein AAGI68_03630 [Planctomycetota bacterium]
MPFGYTNYFVQTPKSQQEVRNLNQTLSLTYGTRGWELVSVTPVGPNMLIYCFKQPYDIDFGADDMDAFSPTPTQPGPPTDPLGESAVRAEIDRTLTSSNVNQP